MFRVTAITPEGNKLTLDQAHEPSIEDLQRYVGGLAERVAMPESFAGDLWVNEESLILELPPLASRSVSRATQSRHASPARHRRHCRASAGGRAVMTGFVSPYLRRAAERAEQQGPAPITGCGCAKPNAVDCMDDQAANGLAERSMGGRAPERCHCCCHDDATGGVS